MNGSLTGRIAHLFRGVAAVLLCAWPCAAQTMSFSVYTTANPANNSYAVGMYTNVVDNSTGCAHSGYSTTAKIISPTGRTASSTSNGSQQARVLRWL